MLRHLSICQERISKMDKYEVTMEGWVVDTMYVTAADKAEAVALATKEFNNRKGINESRVTDVRDVKDD
tara:strand:- start:538 stop:744 length:207 start_codon:yes stop_codon:yes gene_type:complete